MSDFKSKLPDLKEVSAIAGKLFKDLKTSVSEIMSDYKEKHAETVKAAPKVAKEKPKKQAVDKDEEK